VTHGGDGLGMAATGRTAIISGICIARVENDQIVEGWNSFDFLSLYQQLGLLPAMV
jgi:predicted ester cyclase